MIGMGRVGHQVLTELCGESPTTILSNAYLLGALRAPFGCTLRSPIASHSALFRGLRIATGALARTVRDPITCHREWLMDQRDMRKRLREIPNHAPGVRVVLFREQAHIVAQRKQPLEQRPGVVLAPNQP